MPQYYNPGLFPATYMPVGYTGAQMPGQNAATYMYQVDGEAAARAWQSTGGPLPPNTIVPLFDVDGEHVYFKSTDMYGRMNPIRKGRVVIEETPQELPQASGATGPDMSQYVTKDDIVALKQEIRNMISQNNQNGRKDQNRGGEGR